MVPPKKTRKRVSKTANHAPHERTGQFCTLIPIKTTEQAQVYIDTMTSHVHTLGSDQQEVFDRLTKTGVYGFVVKNEFGADIGACSLHGMDGTKSRVSIGLLVAYRGLGYGKLILHEIEEVAVQLGYTTLRADIFAENGCAIELAQSFGFKQYIQLEKVLPVSFETVSPFETTSPPKT